MAAVCLTNLPLAATAASPPDAEPADAGPAARLAAAQPKAERALLEAVLAQSPELARMRRNAAAMAARVERAGAMPDPTASAQLFLLPPETRVGPQRLALTAAQRLPWRGKRRLEADTARHAAAAAQADAEALALALVTEARTTLTELAFADARQAILEEERLHLERHEEAARARYEAGSGPQQAVVRLQSAITQRDQRLLELAIRRSELVATLNRLRDAPPGSPVDVPLLTPPKLDDDRSDDRSDDGAVTASALDRRHLVAAGEAHRPEIHAADARAAQARASLALATRRDRPDVTIGLGYTAVDTRQDRAGRLAPPAGNGDDILTVGATVALPVRRRTLRAELLEQQERVRAADAARRAAAADVVRAVGDLAARLPLLHDQHRLLTGVLGAQAEEAWRSAEIGYATGELGALDLLDAEHLLFEVRTNAARTAADFAIAHARLEHAVAGVVALDEETDHEP